MNNIISKREFGETHEMSNKYRLLPYRISFTIEQFNKIKNGKIPLEFGDRWFIFYEEKILNFHWWSGECIYKILLVENNEGAFSNKIVVVDDESVKPISSNIEEMNELKSIIKYSMLNAEEFIITEV